MDDSGIVVSLVFNSKKAANAENYSRFKNLEYYKDFEKKDMDGGDMYSIR